MLARLPERSFDNAHIVSLALPPAECALLAGINPASRLQPNSIAAKPVEGPLVDTPGADLRARGENL